MELQEPVALQNQLSEASESLTWAVGLQNHLEKLKEAWNQLKEPVEVLDKSE